MNIQWSDLMAGMALAMVLEGLLPFLSPKGFREALITAVQLPDKALRRLGLISMVIGLAVLYWARH